MIEAKHLDKVFGRKTAADDISFTIEKGEIPGVLGLNAAGKSTTVRMITGFLPPTSGTALIGGHDILESSLSARIKDCVPGSISSPRSSMKPWSRI